MRTDPPPTMPITDFSSTIIKLLNSKRIPLIFHTQTLNIEMCTSVQYTQLPSVKAGRIITVLHADVKFVLWLSYMITRKLVNSTMQLIQSLA